MKTDLTARLSALVSRLKLNEPLKNHTTFRIGGPAAYFAEVAAQKELAGVMTLAAKEKLPVLVLGGGSNVLFSDAGFPGIVVRLTGDLAGHSFDGERLTAGAGAPLALLVKEAAEQGLAGFEGLAGIPGTVGGALAGNAGTGKGWIGDTVETVEILSPAGTVAALQKKDLHFSYRSSSLEGKLILKAVFNLKKSVKNDILTTIDGIMRNRAATQPVGTWNAGSVFRNPPDNSAGRLIETCGLKGLRFGGAQVSEKHANFIVNTGHATASDVRALIAMVHEKVKEKFGISLELEIKIIGQ